MSVALMTEVWKINLPASEKLVLLALADCANDEGGCWPSMATLTKKCSKGERTVQAAIKALVDAGHLTRKERLGKGCFYTVHPRNNCTPAETAPPQKLTQTPAEIADKPSRTINVDKANALPTKRASVPAMPEGVELNVWNDFLELRKAKRAPLSNTALAAIEREAALAGWSLNDALAECAARGWQGFKADWVKERSNNGTANRSNHQNGAPRDGFAAVLRDVGSREAAFGPASDDGGLRPLAPNGLIASC
jgi:hypothetical protein